MKIVTERSKVYLCTSFRSACSSHISKDRRPAPWHSSQREKDHNRILQKAEKKLYVMNLCTGLKGKILKGAMPWHHRYIGNLLITWLLNRFYKVGVSDSQCGFRAFTRQALEKLKLEATGTEFATDMLIKTSHAGVRIAKLPITYYPRTEGAPSKLKSFGDSWRQVEYILTYTPKHLYLYHCLALITHGVALMAIALVNGQNYQPRKAKATSLTKKLTRHVACRIIDMIRN